MLKKSIFIVTVFVILCVVLASCTRNGREDTTSSEMSGTSSRSPSSSRPDTASREDTQSRTTSEESGGGYDNASIGDNSEGIIDDIVSGAGDIVSGVEKGIEEGFDGK